MMVILEFCNKKYRDVESLTLRLSAIGWKGLDKKSASLTPSFFLFKSTLLMWLD
jgi:hypothetical protein